MKFFEQQQQQLPEELHQLEEYKQQLEEYKQSVTKEITGKTKPLTNETLCRFFRCIVQPSNFVTYGNLPYLTQNLTPDHYAIILPTTKVTPMTTAVLFGQTSAFKHCLTKNPSTLTTTDQQYQDTPLHLALRIASIMSRINHGSISPSPYLEITGIIIRHLAQSDSEMIREIFSQKDSEGKTLISLAERINNPYLQEKLKALEKKSKQETPTALEPTCRILGVCP